MKKIFITVFSLFICISALAEDFKIEIINKTSLELQYIYVSSTEDEYWGNDILDEDEVLEPQRGLNLNLTKYDTPYFDVRAVDENGDFYYFYKAQGNGSKIIFTEKDRIANPTLTIPKVKAR